MYWRDRIMAEATRRRREFEAELDKWMADEEEKYKAKRQARQEDKEKRAEESK